MEPSESETTQFRQLTPDDLDEAHQALLTRAILRVLATDIAQSTFAQVIDGLPLASVVDDSSTGGTHPKHPVNRHTELCPGVWDQASEFRDEFRPEKLLFDSRLKKLLLAYQAASPASRAFNVRLLEMIAVAIHQIAVMLFKLDTSRHKHDNITEWAPPQTGTGYDMVFWAEFPDGPLPTLFYHPWYMDHEQYPNGAADLAGYWVEARILGGVMLFDRRPNGNPDHVYLLPNRRDVTYRIYQLLPEQKKALLDFLVGESEPEPTVGAIPILGSDKNLNRVDPEEPIEETGIYRDIWERKYRPPELGDDRLRDVWDTFDFPTQADKSAAAERAADRRYMFLHGDRDVESFVNAQDQDVRDDEDREGSEPPEGFRQRGDDEF
ncbi:hypothetical protein ACHAQA_005456 [Verticillium albo-atrum]